MFSTLQIFPFPSGDCGAGLAKVNGGKLTLKTLKLIDRAGQGFYLFGSVHFYMRYLNDAYASIFLFLR